MIDKGLVQHCLELFAPLGSTRAGRMFSGYGFYIDDLFVALLLRDTLYLKVDDSSRAAFEAAGCKSFTYEMKTGEIKSIRYYSAPDEAMESAAEMIPWARRALAAAVATRAAKPARKKPAAAKKTPATKAAAKKAPTGKAVAKKAAAGKAPARKAAAKP